MTRSKAPQRMMFTIGILLVLFPFIFAVCNWDAFRYATGVFLLIALICWLSSVLFFVLYGLIVKVNGLKDEIEALQYQKFRVDELLAEQEKKTPPAAKSDEA